MFTSDKYSNFAIIGCIAMILSLGFDPFIQNLITYPLRQVEVTTAGTAHVTNATNYSPNTFSVHADQELDVSMKANIYASLFNAASGWNIPRYSCPSGNCTFDPYASLGVCAQCTDLTDKLERNCDNFNNVNQSTWCDAWLPNNFTLKRDDNPKYNLDVMRIGTPELAYVEDYQNLLRPIAIVDAITAFGSHLVNKSTPLVASECALTPCVRIYNSTVTNGRYTEKLIGDPFIGYIVDPETEDSIVPLDVDHDLGIWAENYTIPYNTNHGMAFYVTDLLNGNVGTQGDTDYEYESSSAGQGQATDTPTADIMQAIFLGNYSGCATPENGNICAMENLAEGMTKAIRDYAGTQNSLLTEGHVFVPMTFVQANWVWICLPVLIWVLGLVLLVGTAIKTRKAGLWAWGLNPLAVIFLGFDAKARQQMNDDHGMSEKGLQRKADDLKVRLRVNHREAVMEGA